jgi:hypothetical protein
MHRRTAQIDGLGDLCCLRIDQPLLFHNHIQWVQQRDIYVSIKGYSSTSYTTSPPSQHEHSTTLFDTAAEQGKSSLVQSADM